jgi:hypothetical protein
VHLIGCTLGFHPGWEDLWLVCCTDDVVVSNDSSGVDWFGAWMVVQEPTYGFGEVTTTMQG